MANPTLNGGFRAVGMINSTFLPTTLIRETANNYAVSLFQGDVLIPVSDGTVAIAAASNNGLLAYLAEGFQYVISGKRTKKPYLPANTTFSPTTVGSRNAAWVECIPIVPDLIMEVDANASIASIATAIGMIGENCDLATGTGDTTNGQSAMLLDVSTRATTAANFRVFGIKQYPEGNFLDNDVTLTRAKYLVTCNEGFWPPYTTTGA
jgi:hypothetical protein